MKNNIFSRKTLRKFSFVAFLTCTAIILCLLGVGLLTLSQKPIVYANAIVENSYVAEVDGVKYTDLQDAIDNAQEGDTVTLLCDVNYSDTDSFESEAVVIDKSITLDLGDYYIRNTISDATSLFPNNPHGYASYPATLYVRNGSIGTAEEPGYINVVINATNGGVIAEGDNKVAIQSGNIQQTESETAQSDYCFTNLTINGGNYLGDRYAVFHNNGLLTINDGKFQDAYQGDEPQHCIYSHRYDYFFGDFIINGGSFKNFNPACAFMHGGEPDEDRTGDKRWHGYVPEGKTGVLGDDGWYTVTDGKRVIQRTPPSRIDSSFICHCYASIQDAVDAGEADVSLIADTSENLVLDKTEGSSFTFNVDTFNYNGTITIAQDMQLTVEGTSTNNNIVLTAPSKDYHTFLGWYQDASFAEGTLLVDNTITSVTEGGTTYYAKWEESSYAEIPEFDAENPDNDRTFDFGSMVYDTNVPSAQSLKFTNADVNAQIIGIEKNQYFDTSFSGLSATITPNAKLNAGTYEESISVTLHDDSTCTIVAKLVVNKAKVTKPTANESVFTYNDSTQTYTVTESALYTISDNTRKNAGSQTVTVRLNDIVNYEWTDGTTSDVTFTFTINKAKVTKPTANESVFTYTGATQTYTVTESSRYTINDNTRINVGSQTVTVRLNDIVNYEWTDGTTADVTFNFTIGKANAQITVDTTAIVKTYGESITLPVATTNFGEVVCDKKVTDLVNANTYTVTYSVAGTDNYNGDTKTVSVTINKIKVNIPTNETTYTYNGSEQTYALATNSAYTISNDKRTNAGSQTVTVSLNDTANYEWADGTTSDITFNFTIGKANAQIIVDTTAIVKTYGESITLPVATTNFGEVVCDTKATDLVNANTYTVTYSVAGTDNYNGDTKTVSVIINKASFDMSNVTFENKTVKYDGQAQSIEIVGTLPNGVTVEYVNNGKTDVGVYTITANFIYDTVNYNEIEPMTATLTINSVGLNSGLIGANNNPVVIITSANGFEPSVETVITEIAVENVQTGDSVKENEKVVKVYDISLKANGNEIQPDGSITIKILIPTELKDKAFRLVHNHQGAFTDIEYAIEGDYVVFNVDNLSEFLFVCEDTANLGWLIGLLSGVAGLMIAAGVVLCVRLKKKKTN